MASNVILISRDVKTTLQEIIITPVTGELPYKEQPGMLSSSKDWYLTGIYAYYLPIYRVTTLYLFKYIRSRVRIQTTMFVITTSAN